MQQPNQMTLEEERPPSAAATPSVKPHQPPTDLAHLVEAIEAELFHNEEQKHLPLHKKTDLQNLLE